MTAVDRVRRQDVIPERPAPETPRAHVCVLASLNYPDISAEDIALIRRFTRVALNTLIYLGASYELWDTSTTLEKPSAAADFDGLLLLGGGDIDPTCYGGGARHPKSYGVDARADRDAFAVIAAAEAADRPIFGICRGSQLLNVARGGTIIGDIVDYALHHGAPGEPEFVDEPIDITPGTRLASILGADRVIGRSGHHQAVDTLGRGLVVAARALDGITEGVEDPDKFYLGVQWHPEDEDGPEADRMRLFGAFVTAAERSRESTAAERSRESTAAERSRESTAAERSRESTAAVASQG
ncbi:gamma-glutamyl-gamma-aminobutyrate hydrolase family protein [Mycolicibacterium austroafricanum]|uniref:gamma-glutamyl-gamma-aminobutyrate hydrolase family protein n=1 Tax=Mycolicibacterium austroafricanum TaxID=39687 RepID=UPI001CA31C76|nr:gamma-glutamyl-gamma-aminobutyrate hydrolase family protein [Mycolicibacterium austroafricanum]QZT63830.1 gamma-glutamyl-gamma-aminobutyrate hydrolase family protein [Mycolicibacterium austroafricanum]